MNGTFLVRLMGPESIISGLSICAILVPLVSILSKEYASLQAKLADSRDNTMNFVVEAIHSLPQIRFLSVESAWISKLNSHRILELTNAWKSAVVMGLISSWIELSPLLLSATSIAVYSLEHGTMRPSIIFTSLGLFADMHSNLRALPQIMAAIQKSWVGYTRIEYYLTGPEVESPVVASNSVSFQRANLNWPSRSVSRGNFPGLHDVSIAFSNANLNLVTGKNGSGKSLLLLTLMGETALDSGRVTMPLLQEDGNASWLLPGSVAFVSQPPWIDQATIRDNILFGLPFDCTRYDNVITACALRQDLSQIRDSTKVGNKGATLSGGQRWRVALARAMYSRATILLLDDVLSAVDGTVAALIVKSALTGPLSIGRTIILVTHNLELCVKHAGFLVEIDGNTVKSAKLMHQAVSEEMKSDQMKKRFQHGHKVQSIHMAGPDREREPAQKSESIDMVESMPLMPQSGLPAEKKADRRQTARSELQRPASQTSRPSPNAAWAYLNATGGWTSASLALIATISSQLLSFGTAWWLMRWTSSDDQSGLSISVLQFPLGVYLVLSLLAGLSRIVQTLTYEKLGLRASQSLFHRLVAAVIRAPLSWIVEVPAGQLMTLFGADIQSVDLYTSQEINGLMNDCVQILIAIGMR